MEGVGTKWDYVSLGLGLGVPVIAATAWNAFRRQRLSSYSFVFGRQELSAWQAGPYLGGQLGGPIGLLLLAEVAGGRAESLLFGLGFGLAFALYIALIVPIFHYVRSPSIHAYLEERYRSRGLRILCCFLSCTGILFYNIVLLTLCARLISFMIPLSPWIVVLVLALLAVIPGLVGGLSAALDLSLLFVILAQVMVPAVVVGLGLGREWESVSWSGVEWWRGDESGESGALVIPFAFLTSLGLLGGSQALYQGWAPAATPRQAVLGLALSLPTALLSAGLFATFGALARAHSDCSLPWDPWKHLIASFSKIWAHVPSLLGLSVAGMASVSLTQLSCQALGQATALWEDILSLCAPATRQKSQVLGVRAVLLGSVVVSGTGAALICALAGEPWEYARPALLTLNACLVPMTAVLIAGLFLPCTNSKGALAALIGGIALAATLSAAHILYRPPHSPPSVPSFCSPVSPSPDYSEPVTMADVQASTLIPQPSPTTLSSSTSTLPLTSSSTLTPSEATFPPTSTSTTPATTTSFIQMTTSAPLNFSLPQIIYDDDSIPGGNESSGQLKEFMDSLTQRLLSSTDNVSVGPELREAGKGKSSFHHLPLPLSQNPPSNTTGVWEHLDTLLSLSPLLHPVIAFFFSLLLAFFVSLVTGGNDIYSMDWNLVVWTCNEASASFRSCRRASEDDSTFAKRRGRRRWGGGKAAYVASESFRYSRQAPYADAGSNYRNPRVSQINQLTLEANSTTSTSCATEAQTKLAEDFFASLSRPSTTLPS